MASVAAPHLSNARRCADVRKSIRSHSLSASEIFVFGRYRFEFKITPDADYIRVKLAGLTRSFGELKSIAEKSVQTIFDFLIDTIGYVIARLILPIVSCGKVYVEPLTSPIKRFNFFGFRRDESGRIEVESTVAGGIGFATILVVVLACSLLIRAAI